MLNVVHQIFWIGVNPVQHKGNDHSFMFNPHISCVVLVILLVFLEENEGLFYFYNHQYLVFLNIRTQNFEQKKHKIKVTQFDNEYAS